MNKMKNDPYATAEESASVMAKNLTDERRSAINHVQGKMGALGCWEQGVTAEYVAFQAQSVAYELAEQRDELLDALRAITSNPHANLSDFLYTVRERESNGWGGQWVRQWGDAVQKVESVIKKHKGTA